MTTAAEIGMAGEKARTPSNNLKQSKPSKKNRESDGEAHVRMRDASQLSDGVAIDVNSGCRF